MNEQDIFDKLQNTLMELERFKSTTNKNNEEISELYDKVEKINTSFAELKSQVNHLVENVKEINRTSNDTKHEINELTKSMVKMSTNMESITTAIKDVSERLRGYREAYNSHVSMTSNEIEKFKNTESIISMAIDSLKSDISDIEHSSLEFNKQTENRLMKLEEVRVGYKAITWVIGIVGGTLGFILLAYEFYDKILKHGQ